MTRFYERMRDAEKGINRGFFITPEELDRRKPDLITRVFQGIPGLSVQFPPGRDGRRDKVVYGPLRTGPGGDRCAMTIYLDGLRVFPTLGGGAGTRVDDSLDTLVIPTDVAAIEIYPYPVDAPPQYQSLNGRCGVILLWTK
ncbi:MAG TPA: hypothetical protein VLE53_13560, partial [Gemmatimonadaceae bacterium]|nr:hypothetical protein [Gemmatimonadaceae bacterium]